MDMFVLTALAVLGFAVGIWVWMTVEHHRQQHAHR